MYRYSEETSTSSEDDASTAAASAAVSTANMCRSGKVRGKKVLMCTGCGYTSDRRANVTRHYRRIHAQLKKRRECACGEVFESKWQYYEHCHVNHPTMRQSWYTTTNVYKLKQTMAKSKLKSVSKHSRRVEPAMPRTTRASTRLRSKRVLTDSGNDSSMTSSSTAGQILSMTTTESFSSGCSSVDEAASMTSAELFSTSCSSENDSPMKKFDVCKSDHFNNDENAAPRFIQEIAHLPIKKRYLSGRKFLADITNKVQQVQANSNNHNNSTQMRNLYLSQLDESMRAYISHIAFDELDAILDMHYMKRPI